ncbi:hypothetical protein EYF80_015043 [Liparis tanakae]|uniref:Uncharacterized protein n=1 Tax=Liparis tanakae TaxID=230148 RepID=A0A4Z2IBA2_9TELE|nr:hypothetical protein EYF80_015043 [Liparis tanakae]
MAVANRAAVCAASCDITAAVLLELVEVARGDEALPAFHQAVSGQLYQLVVNEAQDPVGQRADLVRGRGAEELRQTLLHLSRCLGIHPTQLGLASLHLGGRTISISTRKETDMKTGKKLPRQEMEVGHKVWLRRER